MGVGVFLFFSFFFGGGGREGGGVHLGRAGTNTLCSSQGREWNNLKI